MTPSTGSYTIVVTGDEHHMVASDIVELIEGHYNIQAHVEPVVQVKLSMVDAYGRVVAYTHVWEGPPLKLVTGMSAPDLDGMRAEVELRLLDDDRELPL